MEGSEDWFARAMQMQTQKQTQIEMQVSSHVQRKRKEREIRKRSRSIFPRWPTMIFGFCVGLYAENGATLLVRRMN